MIMSYIWVCSCGSHSAKAIEKRWLAVHYGRRHWRLRHNKSKLYEITIEEY